MSEPKKICPLFSLNGTPVLCLCEKCAWYRHGACAIWTIAEMLQGIDRSLYEG